jgi:hypothetical protein
MTSKSHLARIESVIGITRMGIWCGIFHKIELVLNRTKQYFLVLKGNVPKITFSMP